MNMSEEKMNTQMKSSVKVLKIEGLTKKFDEITAVNNVNFELEQGEILGIIGSNGSGKTTLFNMISGVHQPTEGNIFAVQNELSLNQKIKRKITIPILLSAIFFALNIIFSIFSEMDPDPVKQNSPFRKLVSKIVNSTLEGFTSFAGIVHPLFARATTFTLIYVLVVVIIVVIFTIVGIPTNKIPEFSFPKRASIILDGKEAFDVGGMRPDVITNEFGIARTFQIVRPFKYLSCQDNATVPHVPRNMLTRPSKLKAYGMRSLLDVDLGEKKNYPAIILPHGDLKRLDISRTLACNPKIILLDEPFSGLGAEDSFRVTQLIKRANVELGTTIMIVEHKLKLLSNLVTRIIVLDQGSVIASGTPKEISENKEVIAAYLGKEASHIA